MTSTDAQVNRAAVYCEQGVSLKTKVVDLAVPSPGPGEVVVRINYSGVCHGDTCICLDKYGFPITKDQVGGHEGTGTVVALGDGVESPTIGQWVGIRFAADACLTCDRCIVGGDAACYHTKISGATIPGTFQQYCLATARYLTQLPEGLDPAIAAPLLCAGLTVYTALKRSELRPGQWVTICGAGGGLGHLAIQYAKALNTRVVGLDVAQKESFCREVGVDEFIDFMQFPPDALAKKIVEITGGGSSAVLMCTGNGAAYAQATSWLGFRGTLACIGIPEGTGYWSPNIAELIGREARIKVISTGGRLEAKECLDIAAQGKIRTHYTLRKIEDLTSILEDIDQGKIQGRVVLDLR